jgi:hypothetical protein
VEALLGETLTNTARERSLAEQLWKLLMSFNGFDDFADAEPESLAEVVDMVVDVVFGGVTQ